MINDIITIPGKIHARLIEGLLSTLNAGSANGVATLDSSGKVPANQLPSYVDDIVEGYYKEADGKFYSTLSGTTYSNEITGESGKIYVDLTTSKSYRWSGSSYIIINANSEPEIIIHEINSTTYPNANWGSDEYSESGLSILDSTLYNAVFQEVADGKEVLIKVLFFGVVSVYLRVVCNYEGVIEFSNTVFLEDTIALSVVFSGGNITYNALNFHYLNSATSTTDDLTEGSNNLYFTNARALSALSSSLSGKLDKLNSSTDNAVVRFDGTTGNIQNSGVTIDDNNKITTSGNIQGKDIIIQGSNTSNTTRYLTSDANNNIYASINSTTPFVITNTEVRRGGNYSSINLGNSSYPWNNVYGKKFIVNGGTSSQFLKADGSVDNNNYAIAGGTSSLFIKGDGSFSEWVYPKLITWPAKEHKHSGLTCLETLIKDSGVNVFAFFKPNYIDVEYSTDGGTTWLDYGLTDLLKINFCTKTLYISVGKKSSGERNNNDKARITFHRGGGVYCHGQLMILYGMFAGGCSIRIEYTTISDPSTYIHWNTQDNLGENPGYVVIPMDKFLFGNNQVNDLRIILSYTGSSYTSNLKSLISIRVYSNNTYSAPSNMATTGHLYDWTADLEMIVPNTIYPTSNNSSDLGIQGRNWKNIYAYRFIKNGGTSSLFLKADGSVDSSVYAPLASPALTGTPTAPTASLNTNTTLIATTAFVTNAVLTIMNASPATLLVLNDLATALGNDPNLATTLLALIAAKYTKPSGGIPQSDLAEPLVHLTLEEYDELSSAEKNNGTWYFIEEE